MTWLGEIKPGLHVEPGNPPFTNPCGPDCMGRACSNYEPGSHEPKRGPPDIKYGGRRSDR